MIIYGATLSPFVRKAVAFATEKGVEFQLKFAGGGVGDDDFKACSPFGKIPALRDGDFTISDSTAIITYLDALKRDPVLIPADPKERARTIWYEEFGDTILAACGGKMFFNRIVAPRFLKREGDLAAADKAEGEELPPILDYVESVIPESGYLVGDRFSLADIAVASPFANLLHLNIDLNAAKRPKTAGLDRKSVV